MTAALQFCSQATREEHRRWIIAMDTQGAHTLRLYQPFRLPCGLFRIGYHRVGTGTGGQRAIRHVAAISESFRHEPATKIGSGLHVRTRQAQQRQVEDLGGFRKRTRIALISTGLVI